MIEQMRVARAGAVIYWRQFLGVGRVPLEQLAIMPLHDIEMAKQIIRERRAARVTEKAREPLHSLDSVRQGMGLLVSDHLQPMLDPAQELVGRA